MIIWRGWGIVVFALAIVAFVGAQLIADAIGGQGTYSSDPALYAGIGVALAGVAAFLLGRSLNDPSRGRTLVDKGTGQEVEDRPRHDFFFIPMEIWGLGAIVLGLVAFVLGLVT